MRVKIAYDEWWVPGIIGVGKRAVKTAGSRPVVADLPRDLVERCQRAEREFTECSDLLDAEVLKIRKSTQPYDATKGGRSL